MGRVHDRGGPRLTGSWTPSTRSSGTTTARWRSGAPCAHGICGSDAMLINGRNRLGVQGHRPRHRPRRSPSSRSAGSRCLKDLIVDMEPFFAGYRVGPALPDQRRPASRTPSACQSAEDRDRFDDTTKCILCAACTTSCPIFWADGQYVGPAAIVQRAPLHLRLARRGAARSACGSCRTKTGVLRCRTTFNCTEACPRGIQVTQAIQDVKRSILFDRF